MKTLIPPAWRVQLRACQRTLMDRWHGRWQQFATMPLSAEVQAECLPRVSLTQPLGVAPAPQLERKRHNLRLAIARLQTVGIQPGQILSFWHLVGPPTAKSGYVEGRTITGKHLVTSVGGGLCQLSGMIYFVALRAGLTIIERYPHSQDIYTDATRFAPLGSDATVVYGYKDLRVQNSLAMPLCFRFDLDERALQVHLCAPEAIAEARVEFRSQRLDAITQVETLRQCPTDAIAQVISVDRYPQLSVPTALP